MASSGMAPSVSPEIPPPSQSSPPSSPSSASSTSSIEFVLSASPFRPKSVPAQPPRAVSSCSTNAAEPTAAETRRDRVARKAADRAKRRLKRLAARFTPAEIAAIQQRKLNFQQLKAAAEALLKANCMQSEVKRAMKTKLRPKMFETINVHQAENNKVGKSHFPVAANDTKTSVPTISQGPECFAGQIIIQHTLSAMAQALSEHGKLGGEPGRHSFHVDAAVSRVDETTGLALVWKMQRRKWASPWAAIGYHIDEYFDQVTAEAWAICQALRVTLQKVLEDRAHCGHDPCSVVVIYTDCQSALSRIARKEPGSDEVVQKIIAQSRALEKLGVEAQLHWTPGHRNVPGNLLADIVSKRARRPRR